MNSFNDPLLYIKGPPVFHLPPSVQKSVLTEFSDLEEESTSIYEMKSTVEENIQEYVQEKDSPMMEQLKFLSKPFQRQVYRPLTFHIKGGFLLQGEVEQLDKKQVTIKTRAGELLIYPVEEVKKVTWRGSILK